MQISPAFETRDYPEIRLYNPAEIEFEFMAYLLLKVSPGNKSRLIEPEPKPNESRKFSKIDFFDHSGALWI